MENAGSPVFIGGINRSGTSLARQLLGSHPDLAIPPAEFEFFKRLDIPFHQRLPEFERIVDQVLAWPKVAEWDLDRELVLREAAAVGRDARAIFVAFLKCYADLLGKPRFGEKTTSYERRLGDFDCWFDDGYGFVHMLRHPIAAYASNRWYAGVEHAIDPYVWGLEWNASISIALTALRRGRAAYAVVRYEDLVDDPEQELRRVCPQLGLAYDERMLGMSDFAQRENSSFDVGKAEYVGSIRHRDDVDRASRIPTTELEALRNICRRSARSVGYDVDDAGSLSLFPASTSQLAGLTLWAETFGRRVRHKIGRTLASAAAPR